MPPIFNGRYAAHSDEPLALLLIGMSINHLWAVPRWWPVMRAMFDMVAELKAQPELGLISNRYFAAPISTFMLVQYWRSFDHLEAYARNRDALHLPAWRRFNQQIGDDASVGVFHETYRITPNHYEAVYVNMPRFGLAEAVQHLPAEGRHLTARRRMGAGDNEAGVPQSPSYTQRGK
jgi:hypothetical protein